MVHRWFFWFVSEQVGKLQVPLLLVVGQDDQNWPAEESAMDVSLEAGRQSDVTNVLTAEEAPGTYNTK